MTPRLFLITPPIDSDAFLAPLENALGSAPFVSVWLRLAALDEKQRLSLAKLYVSAVQSRGVAALVDAADARFAARAGADGLHLSFDASSLSDAMSLRPERIVGVGGLKHRDDAMSAGEAGADYVMFGEPSHDGYCPPIAAVAERCQWWSEIFETPCVGYAPDAASVAIIAGTGVEFVALGAWLFNSDPSNAAGAAARALRPA